MSARLVLPIRHHISKPTLAMSIAAALLAGSFGVALAQTSHDAMKSHNSMMSSGHMMQHEAKHGAMAKGAMMKHEGMKSNAMGSSAH